MKILIIEDDPDDFFLVERTMRHLGCDLIHASSLAELSQLAPTEHPDACMVDLTLPDGRNLTVVERVKALFPSVPVFVLTGVDDESTRQAITNLGVAGWFGKDARSDSIVRAAHIVVALSRMEKQEQSALLQLEEALKIVGALQVGTDRIGKRLFELTSTMQQLLMRIERLEERLSKLEASVND